MSTRVKALALCVLVLYLTKVLAQDPKTVVQGTLYRADGTPASGRLSVTWPQFRTSNGEIIPEGSADSTIGPDGFVSIALLPNISVRPPDTMYTATYSLDDGSIRIEHWRVPDTTAASLSAVLVQNEAHEASGSRGGKPDTLGGSSTTYLPLTGGSLTGPLQLAADPASASQAATKNYVDQQITTTLSLAGGAVTGTIAAQNMISKLPRVDVRHTDFAGGADPTGTHDSLPAIQAAVNYAIAQSPLNSVLPPVYLASGTYIMNGTLQMPVSLHLMGDGKGTAVLQEVNATANLITVTASASGCGTAACYGGIENVALEGSGKVTTGSLLELQASDFILRDVHFYNTGGRGLQMNNSAERVVGYDLSFFYVRWPLIMAGDDNEDYFYNTQILNAGQTNDVTSGPAYFNRYCYSINCTSGIFNPPGTADSPTALYPDPHGSVYIDKAVNVAFIGGSFKAGSMISGVRVWDASVVKFQHIYHEDEFVGGVPRSNRAYILAGKAEQTYLTSSLSGAGMSAAVHDTSWMPQYYGNPADALANAGNYYAYVLLPQDFNRTSATPSAYVAGLQQNQFEIINVAGFASDGNMYVQSRNLSGSTAPPGTQWPAGTVVEQYGNGFEGAVELDNVHINQVQGPSTSGGYSEHCDQTGVYACGEILAGYAPDSQSPSNNPAANQIGFYAPLGDPNDPVPSAQVGLRIHNVEMFSNASNPYVGQIVAHHFASLQITGSVNLGALEGQNATVAGTGGLQLNIGPATGGSVINAPRYTTGRVAGISVSLPDAGEYWDSGSGFFVKKANVFGPYQQYGTFMNGEQFQNLYCLFDTSATLGGHPGNRFCAGGGPANTTPGGPGIGAGIEYDSWNGSAWIRIFSVSGGNGVGSVNVNGSASVSGTLSSPFPQFVMASGYGGGHPNVTLGPAAGTGAVLTGSGGENNMFWITFTTGSRPSSGTLFAVAFGTPINTTPLPYPPVCDVTINTAASLLSQVPPHTGFPVTTTTSITVPASADLLQAQTTYRSVTHCEL